MLSIEGKKKTGKTYVDRILFILLNTSSKVLLELGNDSEIIYIASQSISERKLLSLGVLDLESSTE